MKRDRPHKLPIAISIQQVKKLCESLLLVLVEGRNLRASFKVRVLIADCDTHFRCLPNATHGIKMECKVKSRTMGGKVELRTILRPRRLVALD